MKYKYNKYKRVIASRLIILFIAVIFQLFWIIEILSLLSSPHAIGLNIALHILAFLFVLYVASQRNESSYKILWLIIILTLPVFGTIMYLLWGDRRLSPKTARIFSRIEQKSAQAIVPQPALFDVLERADTTLSRQAEYLYRNAAAALY